jgi:hypothetical protein
MKDFKGTKGKWKIDFEYKSTERISIDNNKGDSIADVWRLRDTTIEQLESNAKLIASAPEMFADIKDLIWLSEQGATLEEIIERLQVSKQLLTKITE